MLHGRFIVVIFLCKERTVSVTYCLLRVHPCLTAARRTSWISLQVNGRGAGFVGRTDLIDTTTASGRVMAFAFAWLFFRQPGDCLIH